jgi:hypothetical protein
MQNYKNKPMPWNDQDLIAGLRIALKPLLESPPVTKPAIGK